MLPWREEGREERRGKYLKHNSECVHAAHTEERILHLSIRPLTSLSSARQSMLMGMEVVLALRFFFNLSHSLSSRRVGRGLSRDFNL